VPVYRLDRRLIFPPVEHAEDGLLAVGGDLSPRRLVLAYSLGIFPWYSEGEPILWHSPDPRLVLRTGELHVSRSLRRTIRRGAYRLTMDMAFRRVVAACAAVKRPKQRGTWITREMKAAYGALHDLGLAHSVEAWKGRELAGGLYGVSLGSAFFGESMFSRATDASKVAFVVLVEQLARWGIELVDCQVHTEHLARFGASEWPRRTFVAELRRALLAPTRQGRWKMDEGLLETIECAEDP
jgi:leucyl/phenylalanyl-tRNA--protein transferase